MLLHSPDNFVSGARVRATVECMAVAREFSPNDVPATDTGTLVSVGRFGFDVLFDDGTLWEAAGIGGHDEPIYFVLI